MPRKQTRGERAIRWIEAYCLVPSGLDRGQHVRLTPAQRDIVREIYDNPNGPHGAPPVTGTLAAYMALLHVCGPEALQRNFALSQALTSSPSGAQWVLICVLCSDARANASFAPNSAAYGQRRRDSDKQMTSRRPPDPMPYICRTLTTACANFQESIDFIGAP